MATQENYEEWIRIIEERNLPVGTIIIDDKWQKEYGTFEIDRDKWPDMNGFIKRQHAKGRRVLLWIPGYHEEGLEEDMCVMDDRQAIGASMSSEKYCNYLRERIRYLIKELDVDGFKIDWIHRNNNKPGIPAYEGVHGIETVYRFHRIVHDESHKWKKDALIDTQTPNSLFRGCSDMLRLNDLYHGVRDISDIMRRRARIARVAGWHAIDTDNGKVGGLENWWQFMLEQPRIGVPALYILGDTGDGENIPQYYWDYLGKMWDDYIDSKKL